MIQIVDPGAVRSLLSSFATVSTLCIVAVLLISYSGLVGSSIRRKMPVRERRLPSTDEELANRNWR